MREGGREREKREGEKKHQSTKQKSSLSSITVDLPPLWLGEKKNI